MWFRSTFDSLLTRAARRPARPKSHPATRLLCETLEDRCLLSYTLTDLGGLARNGWLRESQGHQ